MSPRDLAHQRDLTMREAARAATGKRVDLLLVAEMVPPGARVLDVGCGDGELLELLATTRGVRRPRHRAVARGRERLRWRTGLAVIQGDADTDLADYPDDAFDYVILSQTLQATRQPKWVLGRCCGSAAAPSSPSRISASGGCGSICW